MRRDDFFFVLVVVWDDNCLYYARRQPSAQRIRTTTAVRQNMSLAVSFGFRVCPSSRDEGEYSSSRAATNGIHLSSRLSNLPFCVHTTVPSIPTTNPSELCVFKQ